MFFSRKSFPVSLFAASLFHFPLRAQAEFLVHIINVGYGTAIHVQVEAQNYLFDTGPQEAASHVFQHLADHGVTRLNAIFLSHAHADHIGALAALVKQIHTEGIFWNEKYPPDEKLIALLDEAEKHAPLKSVNAGQTMRLGPDLTMAVLRNEIKSDDLNDNSLVFALSTSKATALFLGDAGPARQEDLARLEGERIKKTQLFVWPHHGDLVRPSLLNLLEKKPDCVVSVGENPYGLPHPALEEQSKSACKRVFSTASRGDLSFTVARRVSFLEREAPSAR